MRLPNKLPRGFSLWDFSQQDITAALTAIEVDLMKAVPIEELTNSAWNCRESEQLAPAILALRAWGEQVRLWVRFFFLQFLYWGSQLRPPRRFSKVLRPSTARVASSTSFL